MAFALWWSAAKEGEQDASVSPRWQQAGNDASLQPRPELTPPERILLERIRGGDHAAFEQLFREHHHALTDFVCGYVSSIDEANDVIADVFVTLWERRHRWQPVSIRQYLYGAVRNLALTRQRDVQRRVTRDTALAADPEAGIRAPLSAQEQLERREQLDALDAIIATLPPTRRVVLMLRWRDGLSFDEIATLTGTTSASVQMQISRALKAVRERFPRALITGD
jgi:RNA polymerase sigma-70 factor (ECF subfamily)